MAKVECNVDILKQLAQIIADLDPRFEILPGTTHMKSDIKKANCNEAVQTHRSRNDSDRQGIGTLNSQEAVLTASNQFSQEIIL